MFRRTLLESFGKYLKILGLHLRTISMEARKSLFVTIVCFCGVLLCGFMLWQDNNSGTSASSPLPMPEQYRYLTIHTNNGRLGNQMFTFATLYGLGALNSRPLALQKGTYEELTKHFEFPHYPVVNETVFFPEKEPWSIKNWLTEADAHISPHTNIVKGTLYPTSYTFFHHVRPQIKELFRFRSQYLSVAKENLRKVKELKPWAEVFVGIHIRRGDYLSRHSGGWLRAFEGREVDMPFFEKATDYFRKRYQNVTFVAVSDDLPWCRENLSQLGVLTVQESTGPASDLALLSLCNHTIMTYGTYGFWGGYLAGGEVVYFSDFLKPNTSFVLDYFRWEKMYPEEWIPISTTPSGYWETYKNPFMDPE